MLDHYCINWKFITRRASRFTELALPTCIQQSSDLRLPNPWFGKDVALFMHSAIFLPRFQEFGSRTNSMQHKHLALHSDYFWELTDAVHSAEISMNTTERNRVTRWGSVNHPLRFASKWGQLFQTIKNTRSTVIISNIGMNLRVKLRAHWSPLPIHNYSKWINRNIFRIYQIFPSLRPPIYASFRTLKLPVNTCVGTRVYIQVDCKLPMIKVMQVRIRRLSRVCRISYEVLHRIVIEIDNCRGNLLTLKIHSDASRDVEFLHLKRVQT